ncbi:hypothetical protein [Pontibacter toksunensis]
MRSIESACIGLGDEQPDKQEVRDEKARQKATENLIPVGFRGE